MSTAAVSMIKPEAAAAMFGAHANLSLDAQLLPALVAGDQTALTVCWSENWRQFQRPSRLFPPHAELRDLITAWVEEGWGSEDHQWPGIQRALESNRLSSRSLYAEKSGRS